MKRAGPLRRVTPLRGRKRLRPMSDRRRGELDERAEVCEEVKRRDRYACRGRGVIPDHVCSGPLDVHEVISRGRGGDWLAVDNCKLLCRAAHDWTHAHPAQALDLRLLATRRGAP